MFYINVGLHTLMYMYHLSEKQRWSMTTYVWPLNYHTGTFMKKDLNLSPKITKDGTNQVFF
jgi:hypothetical protein